MLEDSHLADVPEGSTDVRYWHKADIQASSGTLLGVKRTSSRRSSMSAFDPKQTFPSIPDIPIGLSANRRYPRGAERF
jgi:hypothetical protein